MNKYCHERSNFYHTLSSDHPLIGQKKLYEQYAGLIDLGQLTRVFMQATVYFI